MCGLYHKAANVATQTPLRGPRSTRALRSNLKRGARPPYQFNHLYDSRMPLGIDLAGRVTLPPGTVGIEEQIADRPDHVEAIRGEAADMRFAQFELPESLLWRAERIPLAGLDPRALAAYPSGRIEDRQAHPVLTALAVRRHHNALRSGRDVRVEVALRLDEDIKRGAIIDHNQDDFKEEDVPDEEGVVLPPRPPKREK